MGRGQSAVILALFFTLTSAFSATLANHTHSINDGTDNFLQMNKMSQPKNNSSGFTSNLSWGPSSGFNAYVSIDTNMTMSVNITNGANITDAVDFTLTSEVDWECIWFGTSTPCHQPNQIVIGTGELGWPKYTISVPKVVDGSPLAFVQHPFQLTATSSLDGAQVTYEFTLEPDEYFQAEIESNDTNISLDPGIKERLTFTTRNTGNSPASLVARVVPLTSDGQIMVGATPSLSFQHEGWLVGLFNFHHLNGPGGSGVSPNTQATVDIEIQPPSSTNGGLKIGMILWSANNPSQTDLLILNASIDWKRNGTMEIIDDCNSRDVLPDQSCSVEISITNNGNFEDSYELEVDSTDWISTGLSRASTVIGKGETQESSTLIVVVNGMVPAFSHGFATIHLKLDTGELLASETVELRVAPLVDWELHTVESSTDSKDNVTVAFTLRNLGNGDDGLQVSLHVDMNVEHGFIPPTQATHGSSTGAPRYFEIDQIPPNVNFTFRSWMQLPRDMQANGTITMRVEMQSTLRPDTIFVNETGKDYLAEHWRPENIVEETFYSKLERQAAQIWNEYNGLVMTILVVVAGALGLFQALQHRARKDAEWEGKLAAMQPKEPEKPGEWMAKFDKTNAESKSFVSSAIEAPKIAAKVFTDLFRANAPVKSATKTKPDEKVLDAANTVLEYHETKIDSDILDELAGELTVAKKSHPANDIFEKVEATSGRTVRKPKKSVQKIATTAKPEHVKSENARPVKTAPKKTVTSDTVDDEFDMDL